MENIIKSAQFHSILVAEFQKSRSYIAYTTYRYNVYTVRLQLLLSADIPAYGLHRYTRAMASIEKFSKIV